MRRIYLEVLSRRVALADGKLREVLQTKLDAALQKCAQTTLPDTSQHLAPARAGQPATNVRTKPLADLNHYIRQATQPADNSPAPDRPTSHPELKSARRFKAVWSRIAAANQVHRALDRGPANAGPLNSHMLVLRSLALMQELSPDYLSRFLSQVDTLLWLDTRQQPASQAAAPGKAARRQSSKK